MNVKIEKDRINYALPVMDECIGTIEECLDSISDKQIIELSGLYGRIMKCLDLCREET